MPASIQPDFLAELPARHAVERGGAVAVQLEGRTLTYAQLRDAGEAAAAVMRAQGVKPGDRVVWLGRSSLAYFKVMFGALQARACLTPINTRLAPQEIAFILEDSDAALVFVTPPFFEMAADIAAALPRRITLVAVDGEAAGFASFDSLMETAAPAAGEPPRADDDILQLYTSGTTGRPKGVRLTNANYAYFVDASAQVEGFHFAPHETALCVMPLFHVAGVNFSVASLASGARLVLAPEFNAAEVIRLIQQERVAHLFMVPAMILMLLQAPQIEGADLSSLKTVSYGASPISEAVLSAATARFGCRFVQFYGMTETTGAGSNLPASRHTPEMLRSCGAAWPGMEMRIQDEAGAPLPAGAIGEIAIKGPAVMAGYWKRDAATRETISPDGWLRTGDAGFCDEDGWFFVHDRVKDLIISGGENIYPAEVENAIHGCPGVADAAVIGVPSEKWGEEVKAIVVAAPGEAPTADAIIAWTRQRIAGFKAPKSVAFIDALPRNASGKILRRELREPYWTGRDRAVG